MTVSSTHVLGPEPDPGEEALPAAAVEGGLPGPELLVGRGRLAHEGAGRVVAEELDPVERRVVPEVSLIGLDLELEALFSFSLVHFPLWWARHLGTCSFGLNVPFTFSTFTVQRAHCSIEKKV